MRLEPAQWEREPPANPVVSDVGADRAVRTGVGWVTKEAWHPQPLDYALQMGEFYLNKAVKI